MSDHIPTVDLTARNAAAVEATGHPSGLPAAPALGLAVLTCMDARIVPHQVLGMDVGDIHVIRNAGGRATPDAVRSLVVSTRLLGVRQIAVVHHTACGNGGSDEEVAAKLRDAGVTDVPAPLYANGSPDGAAIAEDVAILRGTEGLAPGTVVEGLLFDVETGLLTAVG